MERDGDVASWYSPDMDPTTSELFDLLQTGWTLIAASLVLFMQAGFCCLEAGSVRHKNSINVALKNIVDLCISFAGFFVIGYALMFGLSQSGIIGAPTFLLDGIDDTTHFFFQATFCGTAATIVSGGIAERCRFLPYVLISGLIGILIYPIYGHWAWGEAGWLSQLGFHDFAGSSVVHMVGAGVALAGMQVLGARQGRFTADGRSRSLPASSMPLVALGVIILTFGWIGFNGGSAPLGPSSADIITATILAACFGGLAALLINWAYGGLARADLVLNGVLGGLVAITAGADCVSLPASMLIGIAGGIAVVIGTALLERLRLDDAVGAVPVHGLAGVVGILLTAVFAQETALTDWNVGRVEAGHAELDRWGFLGIQALGAGACALWAYLTGLIAWLIIGRLTQLRIGRFEETVGLNYSEHQVANPVEELAVAINLAASGRGDEVPGRLDSAGGDLAGLAEAVRSLIGTTERQLTVIKRFAAHLAEVQRGLVDHRQAGEDRLRACLQETEVIGERLGNLHDYLQEHASPGSLGILLDLVGGLRDRLQTLREQLPPGLTAWAEVGQAAQQLDRVLGRLRAGGGR